MVETFRKQIGPREASEKIKGEEKRALEEKAPKPMVEKELKVEEKAVEKARIAEALRKSEEMAKKAEGEKREEPAPPEKAGEKIEEKKEEKKPGEKREIVLERVYTIPLAEAYEKPAKKRAAKAVKLLREFLSRHMKALVVKIEPGVNEFIEARGATSPAKVVRVRASKDKSGVVLAELAGE